MMISGYAGCGYIEEYAEFLIQDRTSNRVNRDAMAEARQAHKEAANEIEDSQAENKRIQRWIETGEQCANAVSKGVDAGRACSKSGEADGSSPSPAGEDASAEGAPRAGDDGSKAAEGAAEAEGRAAQAGERAGGTATEGAQSAARAADDAKAVAGDPAKKPGLERLLDPKKPDPWRALPDVAKRAANDLLSPEKLGKKKEQQEKIEEKDKELRDRIVAEHLQASAELGRAAQLAQIQIERTRFKKSG
jgi:hypothetical protein